MIIIKRNKKAQNFSKEKLLKSIQKAFESCGSSVTDETLDNIYNNLQLKNGMRTEDIQTQIELTLMKLGYFSEAKFFIIWRHINYYDNYLGNKVKFMRQYLSASNAASGSKYDANANVTEKNLTTLGGELFKGDIIKLNRYRLHAKIEELYGKELADKYVEQLESHIIYKHDESSILPYCVSISMYPYLLNGLSDLGGHSAVPKNLESFCGSFINLVFAVAAQFAGAVSTPEFLTYFDYFARDEFGHDYKDHFDEFYKIGPKLRELLNESHYWTKNVYELQEHDFGNDKLNNLRDEIVTESLRPLTKDELVDYRSHVLNGDYNYAVKLGDGTRTIGSSITQYFQQVVYSLNQPAAARSYQSVFWNIGYFDKYYFDGLFHNFQFPDCTTPVWQSVKWLQKFFMKWFNQERTKTVLTFPVESMALLSDGDGDFKDKEMADFTAEMYSEGHSFFTYISDSPDALASCCRLRNEMQSNDFSFSLGAGGVATGSKSVMTINLNRLVQDAIRTKRSYVDCVREQVRDIHKYQIAFNELIYEFFNQGALPVYNAGFISLEKQYLTIGVNGMVEAAEFLGIEPRNTDQYCNFVNSILGVIYEENNAARTDKVRFNTEFVPAENLGNKFYKWDKEAGYQVPVNRNCYNSYFYASEDETLTVLDKFEMHGNKYVHQLDGGSAAHINLSEHLSKPQYRQLLNIAAMNGTNYFTFNIPNTICNECGHIDKRYLKACPNCGSKDIDYATRIIGYLKRISNFSEARQTEAHRRFYLGQDKLGKDVETC